MVYNPELDNLDRPRGILSPADRKYLISDKSGYSYQAQNKRENAILERAVNALLDFAILENHLDDDLREDIFDEFDVKHDLDEAGGPWAYPMLYTTCVADLVAFLYRGLNANTGRHPPFETSLENGVVRGEFEPGTTYFGPHTIEINFERHEVEQVDIPSVIKRLQTGSVETLTEGEMRVIIELLARSDSGSVDQLPEEFEGWLDGFEDEHGVRPSDIRQILSYLDHGNPFEYFSER